MYEKRPREWTFEVGGQPYSDTIPPTLFDLEDQLDSIGEMLNILMEDREASIEASKVMAEGLWNPEGGVVNG